MRLLDWVFVAFFATHIPATLLVDLQCLPPLQEHYPAFAKDILAFHISQFHDPLMATCPVWLQSFIVCELFFQLPFFVLALYAFATRGNWIRIPAIVYGAHTATTLVPILAYLATVVPDPNSPSGPLSSSDRAALLAVYLPYALVPALLVWRMASTTTPFPPRLHPKSS